MVSRCQNRVGHETVTAKKAGKVVNMILGRINPPEGKEVDKFRCITTVKSFSESDQVLDNVLNGKDLSTRTKSTASTAGTKRSADEDPAESPPATKNPALVPIAPIK